MKKVKIISSMPLMEKYFDQSNLMLSNSLVVEVNYLLLRFRGNAAKIITKNYWSKNSTIQLEYLLHHVRKYKK